MMLVCRTLTSPSSSPPFYPWDLLCDFKQLILTGCTCSSKQRAHWVTAPTTEVVHKGGLIQVIGTENIWALFSAAAGLKVFLFGTWGSLQMLQCLAEQKVTLYIPGCHHRAMWRALAQHPGHSMFSEAGGAQIKKHLFSLRVLSACSCYFCWSCSVPDPRAAVSNALPTHGAAPCSCRSGDRAYSEYHLKSKSGQTGHFLQCAEYLLALGFSCRMTASSFLFWGKMRTESSTKVNQRGRHDPLGAQNTCCRNPD